MANATLLVVKALEILLVEHNIIGKDELKTRLESLAKEAADANR